MLIMTLVFAMSLMIMVKSSLHALVYLLMIELTVVISMLGTLNSSYSWLVVVMFLLMSVCLGAFGVSLMVGTSRMKGLSYFISM